MEVTKTLRVPVHYALTKRKLSILDRVTARHTYCVWLFLKLIEKRDIHVHEGEYANEVFSKKDLARIRALTNLNAAYAQQCGNQALWMWRSYGGQHEEWEGQLRHAKGRWRQKLLEREPQRPFRNGLNGKVPVRIDVRTGRLESSKRMKLSPYVIRLSTLKKRQRIAVPLNPAKYHLDLLRKSRVLDFQLVKRDDRYYAHICVKYEVPTHPVRLVRGVDLGVRRAMATVLLKPTRQLGRGDLSVIGDGARKHRLDLLNGRIAELQRAKKWEPLKRMRHKRRHVAEYYDRLDAIRIAELAMQEGSMIAVGYPKGVKYDNYRGNRKRKLRRTLQTRFSYGRRIRYMLEECRERGIAAEPVLEAWTSVTCHRCGSDDTWRPTQSLFWCLDCGLQYNADWNAAINIGSVFFAHRLGRRATAGLAQARDELGHNRASLEAENEVLTTVHHEVFRPASCSANV